MRFTVRRRRLGFIWYTVYKRMHRVEVSASPTATTGRRAHGTPRGLSTRRRHHPDALLILFILHPAVLEPDFDLSLCEVEQVGHLHPPGSAEVPVKVELLFELHKLGASVSCPGPL